MNQLFQAFSNAYRKFNADRCPLLASALVHSAIFSLFPLLLGVLSLSVYVLGSSQSFMDKVVPILKMIAPIGIEEIARSISVVKHTSIIFAIVGIVGFLWGSASIFGAIESSLNVVWEVKKDRSFLKKSLVVVVAAFIVWVILIGSVVITLWMNAIGLRGFSTFLPALNLIVSVMVFGLIYWFFPNCSVGFKSAFAGAVFTSVFWEIAKFLFSIYITRIVDYSKIFGSLSAIVLMLLWLYYSAYIFLFGAELSYVAGQRG